MGQPTWREIRKLKVPDEVSNAWTPALDFVTAGKLYRISVVSTQKWKPEASENECNADGDITLTRSSEAILNSSAIGALIGKIGGSTADFKPDANKVILFGVGRHCVFSVADPAKAGPLYLGMNDTPNSQSKVTKLLDVVIEESL
jgi:hypothetical protein